MSRILIVAAMLVCVSGCSVPRPSGRPTAATLPEPVKIASVPPTVSDGSLWQEETRAEGSLTSDVKARVKGDIVTVLVVEQVDASRTRNTNTDKEQSTSAKVDQLMYPNIGTISGQTPKLSFSSARTYKGGGTVTDSGTVKATVSTQVIEVLPNGNLVIQGSKQVTVSGEVQTVTLTGIARQRDITPDNTVTSNVLAEARVHITGSGPLDDAQRRTLVSRLLDWINLF